MKMLDDSPPHAATSAASHRQATPPEPLTYHQSSDGAWQTISRLKSSLHSSSAEPGSPGLWKRSQDGQSLVFSYPAAILYGPANAASDDFLAFEGPEIETDASVQQAILEWAIFTDSGELPPRWTPPSEESLTALFPKESRVVRHGSILKQIDLIHRPEHLALRVVLATVASPLPDRRRLWLEKYIASADASWRLVRIGFVPNSGTIVAETNLTGAPNAVLRPLFQTAIDALRWVVTGLTEITDFLTKADQASQALEDLSPE